MHLYEKAKLEGKVLNLGDYQVEWSGTGQNVELNIVQGRDTLATVPRGSCRKILPMSMTAMSFSPPGTVASPIEEIFFSGAKYDLKIQPAGKTS